jgi:hypothetical protein
MHPTADTVPVMLDEWCGAAGDAGRWAALKLGNFYVKEQT